VKSPREQMELVNACELVGSYRGAAALCGTTHKTVKRIVEGRQVGQGQRRPVGRNTAKVQQLIAERVRASDGRISAKRLLPIAQAAGYTGSARNLRRAVAEAKATWRRQRHVSTMAGRSGRAPGDRLDRRGCAAGLLRRAGLEPLSLGAAGG
jgi:hypothetical protein